MFEEKALDAFTRFVKGRRTLINILMRDLETVRRETTRVRVNEKEYDLDSTELEILKEILGSYPEVIEENGEKILVYQF